MKKSKRTRKKNWLASIVTILFLSAVGMGVYFLLSAAGGQSIEKSVEDTPLHEQEYQAKGKVSVTLKEEATNPKTEIEPGTMTEPTTQSESEQPEEDKQPEENELAATEDSSEEAPPENIVPDGEKVVTGGTEQPKDTIIVVPEPDLSSMIANAKSYVYTIYTDQDQGSGFLFNDKGDILTNAHVVKDSQYVTVKNSNGQEFNGQVIGFSRTTDIALIRVLDIAGKQPMDMETHQVAAGTKVFALGSPENIYNTSTEGIITGIGKNFLDGYNYEDLYEMTAKIKQGSSGGPLVSAESGKILGINSIILTDNPDIGYSIPVYSVSAQLEEWAASPLSADSEAFQPQIPDIPFEEEALRGFISDFYELVPYSLNDEEVDYYKFFLLPESQAETAGIEFVESLKGEQRIFQAVERFITDVQIDGKKASITANATFTFQNQEDSEIVSISHAVIYTVVVDRFGDYRISVMTEQEI